MTRVLHTADTHLGYRQYHSPERRQDFLEAFRAVVADAIEDDVDAVVHAGDLFHSRTPALADIRGTIDALDELREAGVPFLAVVGNHERTRDEQWLDLFSALGLATRLGREPTRVGDVDVYGLDFVPRSRREDLEYDFEPGDAPQTALVAHGLFTPFNTEWPIESVLEASPVDFDAVLLGDDHHPDTAQVDGTWVTYAGSTERASASEREERGYNLVTFDGDDVAIARRGLDTRPFVLVDLELAPGEGAERVRERVAEEDLEDAVVVVTIEGEGEPVPAARIEEFAAERGALLARVNDRREVEAADEVEAASFADPDEAVRERVREMGLSEAARTIDATVRDASVADTNVRERVTEAVEDLLEEDPDALVRAPDDGEAADAGAEGDGTPTDEGSPGEAADETAADGADESGDEGAATPETTTMEDFL